MPDRLNPLLAPTLTLLALLTPALALADDHGAIAASDPCAALVAALSDRIEVSDAVCFESPDLTTNNPTTTPGDNKVPGTWCIGGTCTSIPATTGAITPTTDRGVISPGVPDRTPIVKAVPGFQLEARVRGDATHEARFLLRVPREWNGKLVVAGASGTRSEFNGDFAWSDYVVQKGYAYASQNKGVLNLRIVSLSATPGTVGDPLACRLNPSSGVWVHFFDNDAEKPFTEWQERIVEAGWIARRGVKAFYGHEPRRMYAVGTSNGGYQVRRAVELAPELFDGGVDWEGTFVDASPNNILGYLPPAIRNFPAYVASGYDPGSSAAKAIVAAGYPPDLVKRDATGKVTASLWGSYWASFWEVTACQWQKRLDPTYDTYGAGLGAYDYAARAATTNVDGNLDAFATTGRIKRPLITVAGTMDALLPIKLQARAYADEVAALRDDQGRRGSDDRGGRNDQREAQYRLYEVQNGNHIETYAATFPQLELIQRHAQRAFDLLVAHVESKASLPPDQCIPRGGSIAGAPSQPGRCAQLLAP